MPSSSIKPRYVALDSSHLGNWVRDHNSPNREARQTASRFEHWLEASGWVPLICWHHVAELLQIEDRGVAAERVRFLGARTALAWISDLYSGQIMGGVIDIHAAEARVAVDLPGASIAQVRQEVTRQLIRFGSGKDLFGPVPDEWLMFQSLFQADADQVRKLVAITRSDVLGFDDLQMKDVFKAGLRRGPELERRIELMTGSLAIDIKLRGDRKLSDPHGLATEFMESVRQGAPAELENSKEFAIRLLASQGITEAEIDLEAHWSDMSRLGLFRSQLMSVAELTGFEGQELVRQVQMEQLPSWTILDALRRFSQAPSERKGSELSDAHLACLSPYVDLTMVDKRTKENLRRAESKVPELLRIMGRVEKAADYFDVPGLIDAEADREPA